MGGPSRRYFATSQGRNQIPWELDKLIGTFPPFFFESLKLKTNSQWHSGTVAVSCYMFFVVVVVLQDISMQQAMLVGWKTFVGLEQGGIYRWTLRLEHICRSLSNLTVTWAFWWTFDRFPRCTSTPNADWSNLALQLDLKIGATLATFEEEHH